MQWQAAVIEPGIDQARDSPAAAEAAPFPLRNSYGRRRNQVPFLPEWMTAPIDVARPQ